MQMFGAQHDVSVKSPENTCREEHSFIVRAKSLLNGGRLQLCFSEQNPTVLGEKEVWALSRNPNASPCRHMKEMALAAHAKV